MKSSCYRFHLVDKRNTKYILKHMATIQKIIKTRGGNTLPSNQNLKTVITIKTDRAVKESAQEVAREIGIPLGTVLNAYLRQFVWEKEARFSRMPRMTEKLENIVGEARKDYASGKNISPIFENAKDMDDYLRKL